MSRRACALLAIDASTEVLAIAVASASGERTWTGPGGAQSSATLLPQAKSLLDELGLDWTGLAAIAFGNGPGAFTGLRTACAVTQGLALGIGCPVIPLDSLAIVAEDSGAARGLPLWVTMDARMDETYAAEYRHDGHRWHAVRAPALFTLPALMALWATDAPLQVAGSALAAFGSRLDAGAASRFETEVDRASALLRLAQQQRAAGAVIDPALALPLYLRDKVASTTAERLAARAGA